MLRGILKKVIPLIRLRRSVYLSMQIGDLNWDLLERRIVLVEGCLGPIRYCGMRTEPLRPQGPADRVPLVKEGLYTGYTEITDI
jgi:hypothetical protein